MFCECKIHLNRVYDIFNKNTKLAYYVTLLSGLYFGLILKKKVNRSGQCAYIIRFDRFIFFLCAFQKKKKFVVIFNREFLVVQ
jgi:hypothetical protein